MACYLDISYYHVLYAMNNAHVESLSKAQDYSRKRIYVILHIMDTMSPFH